MNTHELLGEGKMCRLKMRMMTRGKLKRLKKERGRELCLPRLIRLSDIRSTSIVDVDVHDVNSKPMQSTTTVFELSESS